MKIGIIGAGAYALAVSNILVDNKHDVIMWTDFEKEKEELINNRSNASKLPGFILPKEIKVTTLIEEAVLDRDLLILAVPAQFLESVCDKMKSFVNKQDILITSKGIDMEKLLLAEEIVSNCLFNSSVAVLSGPTFAKDIPMRGDIGLTVASRDNDLIQKVKNIFKNNYINLDNTNDVIGVELCGALKNIYAILMGILEGINSNESTRAMFLTKVVGEVSNILEEFTGNKSTLFTYAGIGDLYLTCNSVSSRNYSYGVLLGSENDKDKIKKYLENTTVEGVYNLKAVKKILDKKELHFEIVDALNEIVYNDGTINEIFK